MQQIDDNGVIRDMTSEEIAEIKAVVRTPTPSEQWRTDVENALVELADMMAGGL